MTDTLTPENARTFPIAPHYRAAHDATTSPAWVRAEIAECAKLANGIETHGEEMRRSAGRAPTHQERR